MMLLVGFVGIVFGGLVLFSAVAGRLTRLMTPNVCTNAELQKEARENPKGHLVRHILFPEDFRPAGYYAEKAAEAKAAMEANRLRGAVIDAGIRANYKF